MAAFPFVDVKVPLRLTTIPAVADEFVMVSAAARPPMPLTLPVPASVIAPVVVLALMPPPLPTLFRRLASPAPPMLMLPVVPRAQIAPCPLLPCTLPSNVMVVAPPDVEFV